jgi:hypothetical protein
MSVHILCTLADRPLYLDTIHAFVTDTASNIAHEHSVLTTRVIRITMINDCPWRFLLYMVTFPEGVSYMIWYMS